MSYSGSASFNFEIERYLSKETSKFLSDEELKGLDDDAYDYKVITLQVTGNSYFTQGRLSGPPDQCYPDEGETEIESVVDCEGKDWESLLTSEERERILEKIAEDAQDCVEPDEADFEMEDWDLD